MAVGERGCVESQGNTTLVELHIRLTHLSLMTHCAWFPCCSPSSYHSLPYAYPPHIPPSPPTRYLRENHNSVLGIREYALQHGASFEAVTEDVVENWIARCGGCGVGGGGGGLKGEWRGGAGCQMRGRC